MEDRELIIGGFYRHFKGKLYQVKCIAYHSETKEKMVVYQALYGDYSVYVRPFDMFMSRVDYSKYPDVTQEYRFEQVELPSDGMCHVQQAEDKEHLAKEESIPEEETEGVNPYLILFLDAEDYTKKLNVLSLCADKIDDRMINAMAASMDIEVDDGPIEKRLASLKSCIRAHIKYEGTRQ
jgi:hypothetical protein